MRSSANTPTNSHQPPARGLADRAINRLTGMDRTEELCLVTAALCAFGSALAAQMRTA